MNEALQNLSGWLSTQMNTWTVVGLLGQSMFMMRFVYQWIASERAKASIMPEAFWYFSFAGGVIVFVYAIHIRNLVFILGQGLGLLIYLRNIYFIWTHKLRAGKHVR